MRPAIILAGCLGWAGSACQLQTPTLGEGTQQAANGQFVSQATFEVRLRHSDVIDVETFFPSDDMGNPQGQFPGVVFLQGGAVETARYHWWARAMAQEGYVVALPTHAFNLAIFSIDNGAAARALLARPPKGSVLEGHVVDGPMAVFGHSLGGVVATKLALRGDFQALGILASYPDPADASLLPSLQAPTLLLAAADDCQAKLSQISEARATLPDPKVLVVVPGATHFQFTDSDAPDVAKNCAPTAPLSEAHDKMARVTKAFLDVTLKGQGTLPEALTALEGVEVQ